jgi:23S rRNA (guanosine2251-2'-O)-methyltransferase
MAFYKDFSDKGTREDKRRAAESKGGFNDEGAQYTGARPPRGGARPAGTYTPRPAQGGARPPRPAGPFTGRPPRAEGNFGNRPPRAEGNFGNRPPRAEGNFGNRPPRAEGNFGNRPPRAEGNFGNRPPRADGSFGNRPPRAEGNFGNRPPRAEGNFGNRPPRAEGNFGNRPPRAEGNFGNRPPRAEGSFGNRPPRAEGNFGNRPPRAEGGFGNRPPRAEGSFGNRPPRAEGGFGNRPPRAEGSFGNRPPRAEGSFGNRPPRAEGGFGNRPTRAEGSFGNRPPRAEGSFGNRPPRAEGSFGNRPPRSNDRPARGGDDGDFRFSSGSQEPYRSRGAGMAPRPYDERKRERRDGPAPRDYNSFRYEAPARAPQPTYDAPEPAEEEIVPLENLLSGRNPIREALKSGRDIEKLLVARGDLSGSAREIIAMAKEQHVPVQEVDRARLDAITEHHQGMLAFASAYQYHTVDEMLALATQRGEAPFLVILDGITDPHNLGAIIRTAECAGAHGVIVQERRAVGLTPAAVKASAGAVEHIMVARVVNLVSTLDALKKLGVWIYAADMAGEDYQQIDFKGGAAVVVGAEGEGVSRLVLENADKRVSLPVRGKLDSLNASVAAGILLYAVLKAR